ncbi:MAG: F0F1 ATP synthase subunit gamma, partial [bacterium]|nr:F0F1 ATP synthase subunit gamma [bacterium]
MATLRTIRLRIKGTKNIKQITRAMEAVSAVKMRKSQGVALAARPYATAALRMLQNLQGSTRFNLSSDTRLNLV